MDHIYSKGDVNNIRTYYPSQAEGGPEGADRGKAHLNDVRFNSN